MNNYLYHHGIKGQKWGVRRYQNEDGSLTQEGRRHYNIERINELGKNSREARKLADEAERDAKNAAKWYDDVDKNGYSGEGAREFVASCVEVDPKDLDKYYKNNKEEVDYYVEEVKNMYLDDYLSNASDAGMLRIYANKADKAISEISKDLNKDYTNNKEFSDEELINIDNRKGYKYYSDLRTKRGVKPVGK